MTNKNPESPVPPTAPVERRNRARREIIKSLVAGGALVSGKMLPENWSSPVIEAVVLPAHAQTTVEDGEPGPVYSPEGIYNNSGDSQLVRTDENAGSARFAQQGEWADNSEWDELSDSELLDYFFEPAHAADKKDPLIMSLYFEGNVSTTVLCVQGLVEKEEGGSSIYQYCGASAVSMEGLTVPGGEAQVVGGIIKQVGERLDFGDFVYDPNRNRFKGNVSYKVPEHLSNTVVTQKTYKVTLTPGETTCSGLAIFLNGCDPVIDP